MIDIPIGVSSTSIGSSNDSLEDIIVYFEKNLKFSKNPKQPKEFTFDEVIEYLYLKRELPYDFDIEKHMVEQQMISALKQLLSGVNNG